MNENTATPVVIVGAGPAGLTAAITLARAGVECLVVDRHPSPAPLPKATVVSVRSMELFRSWGLEGELLAGGNDVEWQMMVTSTLADSAAGQLVDVGYPTKAQSRALSPTAPGCVPQDHLEAVLEKHLRTLPSATLRRSVAMERLRPAADGYVVTLRNLATSETCDVATPYVIGADGAHSTVRTQLAMPTTETERLAEAAVVVFHAPLWDIAGEHRYGIYAIEHPAGAGTLLPAGRDDRWVYGVESSDHVTPAAFVERIRAASGRPRLDVRLGPRATFAFVAALAERFRHDNVFLVGDAAHRVTPRGGTGMNTAIADGFDLGWKLSWVLQWWAPASLLDTFERERRPVAEHQVARSIDPFGSRRSVDELHVDLGGRIRHVWLPGDARRSTLDLLGDGLTVLHAGAPRPPVGVRAPVAVRRLDPLTARALGVVPGQQLVLRPDGVAVYDAAALSLAAAA